MDEGKEVLDYSKTKKLIQSRFTMSVPNEEEKSKELLPTSQGRCSEEPQLDDYLKQEMTSAMKSFDKELAKVQSFIHAVTLLTASTECDVRKETHRRMLW